MRILYWTLVVLSLAFAAIAGYLDWRAACVATLAFWFFTIAQQDVRPHLRGSIWHDPPYDEGSSDGMV